MYAFGGCQFILSSFVLLFVLIVRGPLEYKKRLNAYAALTMHRYKDTKRSSFAGTGRPSMKARLAEYWKFYQPCFKWVVILATLQLIFVQAYPDITPTGIFMILSGTF